MLKEAPHTRKHRKKGGGGDKEAEAEKSIVWQVKLYCGAIKIFSLLPSKTVLSV